MKEKYILVFLLCVSTVSTIFTNKMQKIQCELEKAVEKSDFAAVNSALKRGARADRKVTCIKEFEGQSIQDLADDKVEKAKNKKKADKVRDRIVRAIGQERSGNS